MKIYTKTGDAGETSLLGGTRVSKNCLEIDAIGEVDELNGLVGVLRSLMSPDLSVVDQKLSTIQNKLFVVGSNIANVQMRLETVPVLLEADILALESWIDSMEHDLEPLKNFILPSGTSAAAQSFYVRAVCRRAERTIIGLNQKYLDLDPLIKQYINRLSDTFFVLGRWLNKQAGIVDVLWQK